jgi:hypothetical protein
MSRMPDAPLLGLQEGPERNASQVHAVGIGCGCRCVRVRLPQLFSVGLRQKEFEFDGHHRHADVTFGRRNAR